MFTCLSIVILLLFVGSVQRYVVFSYCSGIGGCCHVLKDSRGGIFSSFSRIKFNTMEVLNFLFLLLKTHCMLSDHQWLDGTRRNILYLTVDNE